MAIFNKGDANTAQTTIISSGTLIKGELHLSCILHIDGNVEGDVISDNTVVIGKNGTARGSIRAKHIVISGKFFGNIEAELVELLGGGVLVGDVGAVRLGSQRQVDDGLGQVDRALGHTDEVGGLEGVDRHV